MATKHFLSFLFLSLVILALIDSCSGGGGGGCGRDGCDTNYKACNGICCCRCKRNEQRNEQRNEDLIFFKGSMEFNPEVFVRQGYEYMDAEFSSFTYTVENLPNRYLTPASLFVLGYCLRNTTKPCVPL